MIKVAVNGSRRANIGKFLAILDARKYEKSSDQFLIFRCRMSAGWGDKMVFGTAQYPDRPYILMRINYGAPPGQTSTNAVILPSDQICNTENGYGLASIYIYFQMNGTYEGKTP